MFKGRIFFTAGSIFLLLSSNSYALETLEEKLSSGGNRISLISIRNSTEAKKIVWFTNGIKLDLPAQHGKFIPCSESEQLTLILTDDESELVSELKCGHSYTLTETVQ